MLTAWGRIPCLSCQPALPCLRACPTTHRGGLPRTVATQDAKSWHRLFSWQAQGREACFWMCAGGGHTNAMNSQRTTYELVVWLRAAGHRRTWGGTCQWRCDPGVKRKPCGSLHTPQTSPLALRVAQSSSQGTPFPTSSWPHTICIVVYLIDLLHEFTFFFYRMYSSKILSNTTTMEHQSHFP